MILLFKTGKTAAEEILSIFPPGETQDVAEGNSLALTCSSPDPAKTPKPRWIDSNGLTVATQTTETTEAFRYVHVVQTMFNVFIPEY